MEIKTRLLADFFRGVRNLEESACKACLSKEFGVHSGMNADEMIKDQIRMFKGLPDNIKKSFLSRLTLMRKGDCLSYYVYANDDVLVFSGYFKLDGKDRIKGNQCKFNVIPTILFRDNRLVRVIKVLGVDKSDVRIAIPESSRGLLNLDDDLEDAESVSSYFAMPKDDFKARFIHVNILSKTKGVDSIELLFPGAKHPSFEKMFPRLEKNKVIFGSEKHALSKLVVMLDDGRVREFKHPQLKEMEFGYSIRRARITDGLNFLWETTGKLTVNDDPFFIG